MCGRFVRISPYLVMAAAFGLRGPETELPESFNIAPGQQIAVVVGTPAGRRLELFQWGFVPAWSRGPAKGIINARSETIADKPSFRDAFRKRRCLVIADGFFEWAGGKTKRPYFLALAGGRPFGMAGIYETIVENGSPRTTCAIVTVPANRLVGAIHDRMPAIVPASGEEPWLDCGGGRPADPKTVAELLQPYPPGEMTMYEVSPAVNSPHNNFPRLIEPLDKAR